MLYKVSSIKIPRKKKVKNTVKPYPIRYRRWNAASGFIGLILGAIAGFMIGGLWVLDRVDPPPRDWVEYVPIQSCIVDKKTFLPTYCGIVYAHQSAHRLILSTQPIRPKGAILDMTLSGNTGKAKELRGRGPRSAAKAIKRVKRRKQHGIQ